MADDLKEQILSGSPLANCEEIPMCTGRKYREHWWQFWLPQRTWIHIVPGKGKVREFRVEFKART